MKPTDDELEVEKLNCVTLLNDADLDYSRKTNDLIERHAKQISDLKARAEAAEAERDALKAELAEAVGVIRPFATAWKIATASGLTGMGQLGTLARGETVGIDFMRARAFLARHQKETGGMSALWTRTND